MANKYTGDRLPLSLEEEGESEATSTSQIIRSKAKSESSDEELKIPDTLPILPLRGLTVYPHIAVPLTVGQPRSVQLIDDTVGTQRIIGLATSLDPENEAPMPGEIYEVGTAAEVHRMIRSNDGTIRLLVQGLARIRIDEYTATEPYLQARVSLVPEEVEHTVEVEALVRNVLSQFEKLAEIVPSIPGELLTATLNEQDPLQLVYAISTYIRMELAEAQEVLEIDSLAGKLRHLLRILNNELEVVELGRKIQKDAQTEIEKMQREYFLREQLKAIQKELGEGEGPDVEAAEFREKIEQAGMPEEAEREARRELERLSRLPPSSAEYGVIRGYLDWLTSLPWSALTEDKLDVTHARAVLDEDHYGLDDIKERILEYLAVRKLRHERAGEHSNDAIDHIRREREGVILCFVGPPGVGKTSLGQSIARAMDRKFVRLSLGGVRDEAEIRGHRRTYIGAMPGRIIQSLRRVESRNPIIMLDEVDKLSADFRGDPASALLEVLDPEQNSQFRDHYLDVPFDLSGVMFIATANQLEPVPGPLRDRMEILQLAGYTENEKIHIARGYLVPRQIRENGLREGEITFSDDALLGIIRDYTREAGVRNLEREIGSVCRKVATHVAESGEDTLVEIGPDEVKEFLGKAKFHYLTELEDRTDIPGVATALAWTPTGGDVMFIEATRMPGSKGFTLTGQLGEVMQESARAALSYVRSKAADLSIADDWFETNDLHLHVPAGAVPKDGPSAGVTMATALASLLTGRPVRSNVAMTGEITLRGKVLPVGGIKEKMLAAHRIGIDTVILPGRNEKDLDDIPGEVREQLTIVLAERVEDVLAAALMDASVSSGGVKNGSSRKKKKSQKATSKAKARASAKKS